MLTDIFVYNFRFVRILNAHHEMHKTHKEKFCCIVNEFLLSDILNEDKTIKEI